MARRGWGPVAERPLHSQSEAFQSVNAVTQAKYQSPIWPKNENEVVQGPVQTVQMFDLLGWFCLLRGWVAQTCVNSSVTVSRKMQTVQHRSKLRNTQCIWIVRKSKRSENQNITNTDTLFICFNLSQGSKTKPAKGHHSFDVWLPKKAKTVDEKGATCEEREWLDPVRLKLMTVASLMTETTAPSEPTAETAQSSRLAVWCEAP